MNRQRARRPRVLEEIGEWEWLKRLGRSLLGQSSVGAIRELPSTESAKSRGTVVVGFGDDAACLALPPDGKKLILLTTDVLIEGTHFTWQTATPSTLGEKAVAVNVSDIAAMGGRPMAMVVALGAPADFPIAQLEMIFRAIARACRQWKIAFVGGDTVRSEQLFLSPTVLGEFEGPAERLPLRNRLRAGQNVYVTGTLGDSAAGLILLLSSQGSRKRALARKHRRRLIERHRRPLPRIDEGRILTEHFDELAMIDLSDDLRTSVGLLSQASDIGMTIRSDCLPISPAVRAFCRATRRNPIEMAICGGEDYELLFAASAEPRDVERVFQRAGLRTPVAAIGRVGGHRMRWLDRRGKPLVLRSKPFEHFAPSSAATDRILTLENT